MKKIIYRVASGKIRDDTMPVSSRETRDTTVISYIGGISEKIRRALTRYGMQTAFRCHNIIGNLLSRTTPCDSTLNTKNVIYRVPCECVAQYFGEKGRPLGVRVSDTHEKPRVR